MLEDINVIVELVESRPGFILFSHSAEFLLLRTPSTTTQYAPGFKGFNTEYINIYIDRVRLKH